MKNKVYSFTNENIDYNLFIAAKTWKAARQFAWDLPDFDDLDNPITDVSGHLQKSLDGKNLYYTDCEGILSITEICNLRLNWFDCDNCGSDKLEALNEDNYKCKECGEEGEIPWND